MIDRRSLIALGLSAPLMVSSLRLDLPDARIHPLNTGGVRVVGISPDASLLVGIRERESLCILGAESGETRAESDPFPELRLLDELSMDWSPDGTRMVFSLSPWVQMRDSDIFIVDTSTGEVTNLTPEGITKEAASLLEVDHSLVDTNPVWLDDETLVFTRHEFGGNVNSFVELTKLTLPDAETRPWVNLASADIEFAVGPIWKRSDDSLVLGTYRETADGWKDGIVIIEPDGTFTDLQMDDLRTFRVSSVNDTHAIVVEPSQLLYWNIPLDAPGNRQRMTDDTIQTWDGPWRSEPVLGPDGDAVWVVTEPEQGVVRLSYIEDLSPTPVAELAGYTGGVIRIHLAVTHFLLTSKDSSWLIPREILG